MGYEFYEFFDAKQRKATKHLAVVKKMLESNGFKVVDKLDERTDPHLFVFNPNGNLSFDGVRVYEIGGQLAYRVQKEAHTQPFGKAYELPIEKMYDDMLGEEGMKEDKIGQEIVKAVAGELKDFFERSYTAEHRNGKRTDPLGAVTMRSAQGSDYANQTTDGNGRQ